MTARNVFGGADPSDMDQGCAASVVEVATRADRRKTKKQQKTNYSTKFDSAKSY
jgi:hypothetical protein